MTPRRRAILIVVLALLLLGIIVATVMLVSRAVKPQAIVTPEPSSSPTDVVAPPSATVSEFVNPLVASAPVTDARTQSRQIAELFAERYGSYSNQGDYRNLRDLLPVMTPKYRAETEAFLKTAPSASGQPYEGVTSKKVSTEVRRLEAASAVIAVSLQQEKTSTASPTTISYRTLRMEMRKVGDAWLVDKADWE